MTEVQELVARLRLKDEMSGPIRKVRAGISGVSDALNHPRMRQGISQIGTGLRNAALIGAAGIGILASQVAVGLNQLVQLEDLSAQTNAAIKSTGGVAGVTADQVRVLAEEYEGLNAVIDDKVIQSGENLLLTFTNIRKEAFEPALEAALDLSVAMDQDLNTSVLQLGKALNDPIRGLTALRRVGVQFTKSQEDQIKALVETGDLLGAQKVILAELGKEFGGRFAAQGKTAKGTIAGIGDAVEDLQKSLATALFPAIQKVLPRLRELLASPEVTKGAKDLGDAIAGLFSDENIAAGADILKSAISTAREAAPIVRDAAKATFSIVSSAVSLFRSLPPEIQKLAIGAFAVNKLTGGLVTNLAGGLISGVLKQLVSGVVNVRGATVVVTGGAGGAVPAGGKGGKAGSALGAVAKVFMVGAAAGIFAELIGDRGAQAEANRVLVEGLDKQTQKFTGGVSLSELKTSLAGVDAQMAKLNSELTPEAIAYQLNIDGVRTAVEATHADLAHAISELEGKNGTKLSIVASAVNAAKNAQTTATNAVKGAVNAAAAVTRVGTASTTSAINRKKWRFQVNNTINTEVRVSLRETIKSTTTSKKLGNVYAQ